MLSEAMLDWNDVQHLRAVGRRGSTNAAARTLGVSQSTVQRRTVALERALGGILVVRQATGYGLTPLGASLLSLTEEAATAISTC